MWVMYGFILNSSSETMYTSMAQRVMLWFINKMADLSTLLLGLLQKYFRQHSLLSGSCLPKINHVSTKRRQDNQQQQNICQQTASAKNGCKVQKC